MRIGSSVIENQRRFALEGSRIEDAHEVKLVMDYTVWRHPDVPLGLAAARISLRTLEDGRANPRETYTRVFTIEDWGVDAKSALPDNN